MAYMARYYGINHKLTTMGIYSEQITMIYTVSLITVVHIES